MLAAIAARLTTAIAADGAAIIAPQTIMEAPSAVMTAKLA
jgi:hypothetical protein